MTMRPRRPAARRFAAVLAATTTVLLLALPGMGETEAAFTDEEHVSATVTGGTLARPTTLSCSSSGVLLFKQLNLVWGAPASGPAPTRYVVEFTTGTTTTRYTTPTNATSLAVTSGLLGGLSDGALYSIVVRSSIQGWTSNTPTNAVNGRLSLLTGWTCPSA